MTEHVPVLFSESLEELQLNTAEVCTKNQKDLEDIRTQVDTLKNLEEGKFSREIRNYAEGDNRRAFVSKYGDKVVGYVEVEAEEHSFPSGADRERCKILEEYAHVARIGVDEAFRGKHIGTRLLEVAEKWVKDQHPDKEGVWLDYLPGSNGLENFYHSAGYADFEEFMDGEKDRLRRIAFKRFR